MTVALAAGLAVTGLAVGTPSASAGAGTVVILDSTVSGGMSSFEATYLASQGFTVDLVDATEWGAMSTGDFASYRAIILGDPNCSGPSAIAPAEANAGTWGAAVTGEVIIIGTDPMFHSGQGQANQLMQQGMDFAVSDPSATGLYMTTSCYYDGAAPGTPIPALNGIDGGGFTASGTDCDDQVHITATHPALTGLTDEGLSDWGCSTHNAFDTWAPTFAPLAMAVQEDGNFVAPDGTRGEVYIIARGVEVFRALNLSPETATNEVGTSHTVTAAYNLQGGPVVDAEITFTVTEGPHAGTTGTARTDAAGNASFSYMGTSPGTDSIVATALLDGFEIESNVVTKTWIPASTTTTARPAAVVTPRFTG